MTDEADALFDMSLNEMADMPEFKPLPPGGHKVIVNFNLKKIGIHPAVEMKIKLIQTMELADPQKDTTPEPGAETSCAYMLDIEMGQGKLKEIVKPICERFGIDMTQKGFLRQVVEQAKDLECMIVSTTQKGKEEGQLYMNVKALAVV